MAAYQEDEQLDEFGEPETFAPLDPFQDLTRGEQDVFFRILDMLAPEQMEGAMDYFMDHPEKIRTVVDYVKKKKQLLVDHNIEELNRLFAQERIMIQKLRGQQTEEEINDDSFALPA
ncbi:MAG: hypothetical protein HYV32_05985 [Candidatus Kerfeldbacteria bacterium]|nr:hypothetical protein [Candidatus Kerfeldbacteria bacterium]